MLSVGMFGLTEQADDLFRALTKKKFPKTFEMDKKVLENNQSLRTKRKQNFPKRIVSKVKDRPKHT